jgi:Xaa-Pro aminopeptidase
MSSVHAARRELAAEMIIAVGADAALITSGVNVRYLTGLVSSNAAVLLAADASAALATDSRYAGTARRECPDIELVTERMTEQALARLALGLRESGAPGSWRSRTAR